MTILEYVQHEKKRNGVSYSSKNFVAVVKALVNSANKYDSAIGKGDPVVVDDVIRKYVSAPEQPFYVSGVGQKIPETCIFTWIEKAFVANAEYIFNKNKDKELSAAFVKLKKAEKKFIAENMPIDNNAPSTLKNVKALLEQQAQ